MLQLVSEQYDSYMDGMEYGLLGPERIAQLDREDLDRYQRSMRNSSFCASMDDGSRSNAAGDANTDQEAINEVLLQFRDETKTEMAELKSEMSEIISLLRDLNNELAETPVLLTLSASPIEEHPVCNDVDSSSNTTSEADGVLKVNKVADAYENTDSEDDVGSESTTEDSVIEYDTRLIPISNSTGIVSCETAVKHSINGVNKHNEGSDGVILCKMANLHNACQVFDEMTGPFLGAYMLDTAVTIDAHKVLDEMLVLSPTALDEDFIGKKDPISLFPYIMTSSSIHVSSLISGILIGLSKVSTSHLNYENDVLGVSIAHSLSFSRLRFNLQVFDPGTLALFKQEDYGSLLNENEGQLHCKVGNWKPPVVSFTGNSCSMDADTIFVSVISSSKMMFGETAMFMFEPGISPLHLTDAHSEVNGAIYAAIRPITEFNLATTSSKLGVDMLGMVVLPLRIRYALFHVQAKEYCAISFREILEKASLSSRPIFIGDKVISVDKVISCRILFSDRRTYSVDLASSVGTRIGLLSPLRANFVWDPCHVINSFYILEDKDDFKRVGKWIVIMEHISTMPMLMNCGEDNFGAITLQQARDTAYASARSSKLGNILLSFSLQTLYPRYVILISIQLIRIESHYQDNLVQAQELGCHVDKNAFNKFVFRHLLVNTVKDLHSLMIHIFNDGVGSVNFKWSAHHLFALSLFQVYKVRMLKKTCVAMRIRKYLGLYRHSQYSFWSKFGWIRTPIVWLSRCTVESEVAEYIALEVKGSAHHILDEDMYAIQGNASSFGHVHQLSDIRNCPLFDDVEIRILVFDPGGNSWLHMVWCSLKTNDDKHGFDFGLDEHNAGSFCAVFRWKVGQNVAIMLGLVSSIVAWADGDYHIKICFAGIIVQSGSNACHYVLLLDGGINAFGNDKGQWLNGRGYNINPLVAVVTGKNSTLFTFIDSDPVWDNMVKELENYIWDPGLWGILHHSGYIHTTLFKFGCIASMISFKKMLNTIKLMQPWVYHCDSRKPVNIAAVIGRMNFKENFCVALRRLSFRHLEDKVFARGG